MSRMLSFMKAFRVGVVFVLNTLAERLGISKALGSTRQGVLALWQIMARLIGQGSRLGAVRMAASYGACDVLELESFTEEILKRSALLDGCYVIKTDVKKELLSTKEVHDRYKDLAKVEHAFRTFKQSHLEIRPVHVRTEASTRGHVFAVMLAYKIERLLSELWKKCECSVLEGIDELGAIRSTIVTLKESSCQKIPQSK